MAEQNGAQSRRPPGQYPEPQSYPSPQMQSAYAYPPPQGQAGEPYQHSPSASNAALPPVNLPPLRSIDGQSQPPQLLTHQNSSQLSQPMPPMASYYQQPPPGVAHLSISHPAQGLPYTRYAAIPQGSQMSGGRHKKEIKRRTKTGCLTCRKRRIKCDEQHPICRNCQKSKRDCLGYDPIFKQQSGPHTIQAAPSASPSSASPTPASASAPPPFSPRQTNYPHPPPPHSAPYPPTPTTTAVPRPSHHDPPPYEYTSAIDPALAESPKTDKRLPQINSTQSSLGVKMESAKGNPARRTNVEDLFQVDRYGPYEIPADLMPLSDKDLQTVKALYLHDFAPGLDKILETQFYTTQGVDRVLNSRFAGQELIELAKHYAVADSAETEGRCRATEARAIWRLLTLCRPPPQHDTTHDLDLQDTHARLEVLECLITNRLLDEHRVRPVQWQEGWSKEKLEDLLFWAALAKFCTRRNDDATATQEMDKYLMQCRNLLNGKENRDVIYSIMVTRHFGWRVPNFPRQIQPEKGGENSVVNKVFIASQFISDQAQFKGTHHPIQRLCDMVVRSWAIGW